MAYSKFNYIYLTRVIYANGNEYKTVDEIYNLICPPMDRIEFDGLMLRLRNLVWLDEHNLTHKIRINNVGEVEIKRLDRQEEERLRLERQAPQKRPIYKLIIEQSHKSMKSAGIWILNNIIGVVIATLIAAYLIYRFGWNK
jgi:hypothetical protein